MKPYLQASIFAVVFGTTSFGQAAPQHSSSGKSDETALYVKPSKVNQGFCDATKNANLEAMKSYRQLGANIDEPSCEIEPPTDILPSKELYTDSMTPLMHSIAGYHGLLRGGNPDVFKFLLENGANVNYQDRHGRTSLMLLANDNNKGMNQQMEDLFNHGAKVGLVDKQGDSALFYAASASIQTTAQQDSAVKAIEYLVRTKGANVNATNYEGFTPLMFASRTCSLALVREFVSLGADPITRTRKGDTASTLALETGAKQSLKENAAVCNKTVAYLQNPNSEATTTAHPDGAAKTNLTTKPINDVLKSFQKDKTTFTEVVSQLGEPISQEVTSSGAKYIYYGGSSAPYNTVKSIPLQALFMGSSDMSETFVAVIIFDKNDLLTGINAMRLGGASKHQ